MGGKKWSAEDSREVMLGIGAYGVAWFERKSGRSRDAIYSHLRRNYGCALGRGTYSLDQAARNTGYAKSQLLRARDAMGQRWKRLSATGTHLITEEQVDDLVVWLGHDYWCKKYRLYACITCGEKVKPPKAHGRCSSCYFRARRRFAAHNLPFSKEGILDHIRILRRNADQKDRDLLIGLKATFRSGKPPSDDQLNFLLELSNGPKECPE